MSSASSSGSRSASVACSNSPCSSRGGSEMGCISNSRSSTPAYAPAYTPASTPGAPSSPSSSSTKGRLGGIASRLGSPGVGGRCDVPGLPICGHFDTGGNVLGLSSGKAGKLEVVIRSGARLGLGANGGSGAGRCRGAADSEPGCAEVMDERRSVTWFRGGTEVGTPGREDSKENAGSAESPDPPDDGRWPAIQDGLAPDGMSPPGGPLWIGTPSA